MGTIPTELLSSHTSWRVVLILSSEPTYSSILIYSSRSLERHCGRAHLTGRLPDSLDAEQWRWSHWHDADGAQGSDCRSSGEEWWLSSERGEPWPWREDLYGSVGCIITSCYNFSVHSGYKMIQPHICNEDKIYDMLGIVLLFLEACWSCWTMILG